MLNKAVCILAVITITCTTSTGKQKMQTTHPAQKHTNRLIDENSPYLLQHAHNPVDWYPWSDAAFAKAKQQDKPIFLSIGYSTCHWCHVMETESFENEHIAKIMNDHFISIKVDREQRPDIDSIYMNAVVTMTGSGGWPLSVFLTPDGQPFYGGTYFPPKDLYGRPGFERVLLAIADAWKNERQDLIASAAKLTDSLKHTTDATNATELSPQILTNASNYFESIFDTENAGFGQAPKFPQPTNLSMLLTYWHRTKNDHTLQMVERTLDTMAKGGIYDHLGGGFHRYATDPKWLIPHFEKMLYDQALLSKAYIAAYQATGKQQYAATAKDIFDYILRDMTDPAGGFYAAQDADSEGKEGTFYLWTPAQIDSILSTEQAEIFNTYYGVTKAGNFEDGKTILSIITSKEHLAKHFNKPIEDIETILKQARAKTLSHRQTRIKPHLDDKVITAWNALMISSLAHGGTVLNEEKYIKSAARAANFILDTLHKNNRLMRYYRNGRVTEKAFLNDYAFMIDALLTLYQADFDPNWLIKAKQLAGGMISLFADTEQGGFFLTGNDTPKLIARTKPHQDSVIPSGNSAAAMVLLKLSRLTMDTSYAGLAQKTLQTFSQQMHRGPGYSSAMLMALNYSLGPSQEIIIAAGTDPNETSQMLRTVRAKFLPTAVILLHPQAPSRSAIEQLIPFIKNYTAIDNKATAYLCENYVCKKPVNKIKDLETLLNNITEIQKTQVK